MSDNDYDEFYRLWNDFGRNMNTVAILTLLTIVTGISGFVAIIIFYLSLGNIKRLNSKLNSLYLYDFRSKMVSSFILKIISLCLLAGGITGIVFSSYFWFNAEGADFAALIVSLILTSSTTLIGLILGILGFSIEMKAWENLKYYIEENRTMFPEYTVRETITGAENLRNAALMYAIGFFGITLIIGFILQISGFFKLAKFSSINHIEYPEASVALKAPKPARTPRVPRAPRVPRVPQAPKAPTFLQEPSSPLQTPIITNSTTSNVNRVVGVRPKFCPNCGAEIQDKGAFCPDCGSSLS